MYKRQTQVATRINQDPDISQIFTLLDQQGSSVIKGNLFVVPINQSVLYYQPIYLQGEQNPLPEFKFVVVVFQDRIIMAESLSLALEGVFGDLEIDLDLDVEDTEDISAIDLLNKASDLFDQAQNALTDGNLGKYQDLIIQVEELVNKALEILNQQ